MSNIRVFVKTYAFGSEESVSSRPPARTTGPCTFAGPAPRSNISSFVQYRDRGDRTNGVIRTLRIPLRNARVQHRARITGNPEVIPGQKSRSRKCGVTEHCLRSDLREARFWPVTGACTSTTGIGRRGHGEETRKCPETSRDNRECLILWCCYWGELLLSSGRLLSTGRFGSDSEPVCMSELATSYT
jgi:hypothetical protein